MKHIYMNLKRFDVPVEFGGVNRLAPVADWASCIVKNTQEELKTYDPSEVEFGMYFPEVHLLNAAAAKTEGSPVQIGCRVYSEQILQLAEILAHLLQTDRLRLWQRPDVRLRSSDTVKREMIKQESLQRQVSQIQML